MPGSKLISSCLRCYDINDLLLDDAPVKVGLATIAEGNYAGDHRVEGVVFAYLHIATSLDLRTALADDDHTWTCSLAIS